MNGLIQPGDYGFRLCITRNATTVLDISMDGVKDTEKAKRMLQRTLNEYFPSQKPENPAPDTAPKNEPAAQAAPPKSSGIMGAVVLHCKVCGNTFGTFLKEPKKEFLCKCGQYTDLTTPMAGYWYVCPDCGRVRYGQTNVEAADLKDRCACGCTVSLTWDAKERRYLLKEKHHE